VKCKRERGHHLLTQTTALLALIGNELFAYVRYTISAVRVKT